MPIPRKSLINCKTTPYYHCVSRCVQQAYLCGKDQASGKNYEHRRAWILDRLMMLAEHFCIDVCAYSIMHNHYHLVLKINKEKAKKLTENQIIERWCSVYCSGRQQLKRNPDRKKLVKKWRKRLFSISWFMRAINEYVAKRANREDGKKGHFWDSRFKSQALVQDIALLSCMVYVDLNPVRAGIADTLENSDFTSIQKRIRIYAKATKTPSKGNTGKPKRHQCQPLRLLPFADKGLHFSLPEYFRLVDITGRMMNPKKRGSIDKNQIPLLESIGLDEQRWLELSQNFEQHYASLAKETKKQKRGEY